MDEKMILFKKLISKSGELALAKEKKMEFLHRLSRPSITKEEILRMIETEGKVLDTVEKLTNDCIDISDELNNL